MGLCCIVRPMASEVNLIHFLNPLLNQAPWTWGVPCQTSSSFVLVSGMHCARTEVFSLWMGPCNPELGDWSFQTSCTLLLFSVYPILAHIQTQASFFHLLTLLFSTVLALPTYAFSPDLFFYYVFPSSRPWLWSNLCGRAFPSTEMGQSGGVYSVQWPGRVEGQYHSRWCWSDASHGSWHGHSVY